MENAVHSSARLFSAIQCLLMAKASARMPYDIHENARCAFWETLPDVVPDLAVHLPALTSAIRDESEQKMNWPVLERMSLHPLPATLSADIVGWRAGLITAWEERLKKKREWKDHYMSSLRGLIQAERCGLPSGMTGPSVLPTLLNEARDIQKIQITFEPPFSIDTGRDLCEKRVGSLAALSDWRPTPNVITDPAVLKAWADFWLELYQKGNPDDPLIIKGIVAKALLNLMETGIPAGMESLLLESLTRAVEVAGVENPYPHRAYPLSWLSWQPQDVTRFPADKLAKLPETLLKRFSVACQELVTRYYIDWPRVQSDISAPLGELVKWDRAGLLAACRIDVLPCVITGMNNLLNKCTRRNSNSVCFLNNELCEWFIRDEVANVEGGKELLQKLENHWRAECQWGNSDEISRCIAWKGRMQLQRTGLATETVSDFHESLLEAIKKEHSPAVRLVLSLWSPEKNTPKRVQRECRRRWRKGLKSSSKVMSKTAALMLLRPSPSNDPVIWRQKLPYILSVLPENTHLQLSIADMTNLMGELLPGDMTADPNAAPGRTWQFKPDEMRFRVPTEPATPVSTPVNVQTVWPDRMV